MSGTADLVLMIRAVIFAEYNITFSTKKGLQHKFGLYLLQVLSTTMSLSDTCGQHAMVLWTITMARSTGFVDMNVCVACLVLSVKMHDITACAGLSKFVLACRRISQSREGTAKALEWTLQQDTGMLQKQIHHLTCILKLFENVELTREVSNVCVANIRYAEIYLLFTVFRNQWYHYLIQMYEYLLEKTCHLPAELRKDFIFCVCGVDGVLTL